MNININCYSVSKTIKEPYFLQTNYSLNYVAIEISNLTLDQGDFNAWLNIKAILKRPYI